MRRLLPVLLVLLPAAALAQSERPPEKGRYNTPESAPPGWTVVFPDFKLKFLGTHGPGPESNVPISFNDYELEGRSGNKKTITYATLGNIAAQGFCFEGRVYSLELFQSEKFGKLAPYEFVLWKKPKGTPCDERQGAAMPREKDPS
ncbi:MAG: hypothetical protein ACJ76N_05200 [Thermoanaerobaculia bacterium]